MPELPEDRRDRLEVYTDAAGEHRWHLIAPNGRIIADSGEGYTDRAECVEMGQRATGRIRESVHEDVAFAIADAIRKHWPDVDLEESHTVDGVICEGLIDCAWDIAEKALKVALVGLEHRAAAPDA